MSTGNDFFSRYSTGVWGFVTRTVVTSLAVILAAWVLPGVTIRSVWAAVGAAVAIGVLDNVVRPGIVVATLPFTLSSMGCFLFVINGFIILLAALLVPGFELTEAHPFWTAVLFSMLLTLFNYLLELPNRTRHTFQPPTQQEDRFDDYEDVTEENHTDRKH